MKIIVLSSHTTSLFWFRMDMMKAFIEAGHRVIAIGNEPEDIWQEKLAEHGVLYRSVFIQRTALNPFADIFSCLSLRQIFKEERPDKIFTYQAKTVIYGGIAAKTLGITEVYPLIGGLGSIFISTRLKNRIVSAVLKMQYKFAMSKSPKVFFQNHDDSGFFINNKIIPEDKVVYLNGSGVNLEIFKVQPLPSEFGFLFMGRLIGDKGVVEYLEACRIVKQKYPLVKCLLVGLFDTNPSALKPKTLQPYIDDSIVEYLGEAKNVIPYLKQCNVFVLPSYSEGTPKTVLEAMACGKAIITTNAPGCKETVTDGINGFLIPVKDISTLADKMIQLYENQELVSKMGRAGRQMAEDKFDVKKVNCKILKTMLR